MHSDSDQHTAPVADTNVSHHAPAPDGASARTIILFALIVLIIVLPIRLYIAKPFIVSGTSMYPTFDTWHYLIIDQLTYHLETPTRGDVVVFRFPQNPSRFFIKRIIALPGETIALNGTTVTITNDMYPDGAVINEPYVLEENARSANLSVTLGDNEYFVMGDNRRASADSRYWGPLERERIVGRAYMRLFPLSDIGLLPGDVTHTFTTITQ